MAMAAALDFWFDFASTYSYLSALRIEQEAASRGVAVCWRPFLLGPIFAAQGWSDSPFNLQPAKGRYMWRDMERRAATYGLPFSAPADPRSFPRRSVPAARVALKVLDEPWGPEFCRQVFTAEFAQWQDIADPAVIDACLARARGDRAGFAAAEVGDAQKAALWTNGEEAVALGLFGAPSFVVSGEIFWGDDRLEDALDWAMKD